MIHIEQNTWKSVVTFIFPQPSSGQDEKPPKILVAYAHTSATRGVCVPFHGTCIPAV